MEIKEICCNVCLAMRMGIEFNTNTVGVKASICGDCCSDVATAEVDLDNAEYDKDYDEEETMKNNNERKAIKSSDENKETRSVSEYIEVTMNRSHNLMKKLILINDFLDGGFERLKGLDESSSSVFIDNIRVLEDNVLDSITALNSIIDKLGIVETDESNEERCVKG